MRTNWIKSNLFEPIFHKWKGIKFVKWKLTFARRKVAWVQLRTSRVAVVVGQPTAERTAAAVVAAAASSSCQDSGMRASEPKPERRRAAAWWDRRERAGAFGPISGAPSTWRWTSTSAAGRSSRVRKRRVACSLQTNPAAVGIQIRSLLRLDKRTKIK